MQKKIDDACEGFLDHRLNEGGIDEYAISDWVHEFYSGTAWDQGLDTDALISLADDGLDSFGDTEVEAKNGFRPAISAMAYYGFTSAITAGVSEWLRENDLEELGSISDTEPHAEWREVDDDGVHLFFEDDDDDEYEAWKKISVDIGDKEVTFWAEVTDEYEITNIMRMRWAVERGREEQD